jgi:hypothetical protein
MREYIDMGTQTLIPLEEYLNTSYSPDREYRDDVVLERNLAFLFRRQAYDLHWQS